MGYPMTYPRMVNRNGLTGDYSATPGATDGPIMDWKRMIAGDLRRLEKDARDDLHVARFAKAAGVSKPKALAVLNAFFSDFMDPPAWLAKPCWPDNRGGTDVAA